MPKSQLFVRDRILPNKAQHKNPRKSLGVLFTCIGKRVSLLNSFRRAAGELKINASFFGTDTTELTPAL